MPIVNPNTETASFATTGTTTTGVLTTANADLDNPATAANTVVLITLAPPNDGGGLITALTAIPRATVAATGLHLFTSKDSGANKELVSSILMPLHTVATGTAIPVTTFTNPDGTDISEDNPYRLGKSEELYVSADTALAGGIAVNSTQVNF